MANSTDMAYRRDIQSQYTAHSLDELLNDVPKNQTIGDNLIEAF